MDQWERDEDPIAFAKKAAEELAPLGVRYFEFGGMKLAFEPLVAHGAPAPGAVNESGLSSKDEAELERLMEADSTGDPIDDPTTFPGGRIPTYRAPRRRAPAPERDAELED